MHWRDAVDNLRMRSFMQRVIYRFEEVAKGTKSSHPYRFQNHAFEEQDVFAGYGTESRRRLLRVRKEVDPSGIFQTLQPGFFKLGTHIKEDSTIKSEL